MRKGLLFIAMFGWLFGPPSKVQEAHEFYENGKFMEAGLLYKVEVDNYVSQTQELMFNSGQCFFQADSLNLAMTQYGNAANMVKHDAQLASWAWNNIGIVHIQNVAKAQQQAQQSQPQQGMMPQAAPSVSKEETQAMLLTALQAFKDALKLHHDNDIARYNYELLMRKMKQQEEQQDQQQQDENKDQQQEQKDQEQNKPKEGKDQENDSPDNSENNADQDPKKGQNQGEGEGGKEGEMSKEEAQRLLEAMDSNEKQYLQQRERGKKRKVYAEKDGHDW